MTILSDVSLEFARLHIEKFYDSDFFPKPREFEAIWHNWEAVKSELTSKNIQKMWITPPRIFPTPKPSGDFRIVHQLEPIHAIIYTSLAYEIAPAIEIARMPEEKKIACSYRLKPEDGNFLLADRGIRILQTKQNTLPPNMILCWSQISLIFTIKFTFIV